MIAHCVAELPVWRKGREEKEMNVEVSEGPLHYGSDKPRIKT